MTRPPYEEQAQASAAHVFHLHLRLCLVTGNESDDGMDYERHDEDGGGDVKKNAHPA